MTQPSNAHNAPLPVEAAMPQIRPILHAMMAEFIQAAGEKRNHRVMFVSPEHGDGTTTVAVSSALMLVRHFRSSVALVEANLYTPSMAAYLDIPPGPGLLDVAEGTATSEDAVRNSKLHGLYVLTAGGTRPPEEGELAGEHMRELIRQVSETKRYTLIDAPPLLEHPETCLLLEHVDEVVMVVRAGSTHEERAKAAIQIVKDAGVEISGVFLNRFKPDLPFGFGRLLQN